MAEDSEYESAEAEDSAGSFGGSSDEYTSTESQSWFQRLGSAIAGVLVGAVLFLASFPLLWWNEGRAVKTAKGLAEFGQSIVSADAASVNAANEKKPVHITGEATTSETLADPVFPVSANAIKLKRVVEMYQWKEEKKTETHNKVGGGTEKRTKYTYDRVWNSSLIDSRDFHNAEKHVNPREMRFRGNEQQASDVQVGAFRLSPSLIGQMNSFSDVPIDADFRDKLPNELQDQLAINDGKVYFPNSSTSPKNSEKAKVNPAEPAIGDIRIAFKVVKPTTVSIAAQQFGNSFEPWHSNNNTTIERLMVGNVSASEMVSRMQSENNLLTWVLRAVGTVLMGVGIGLVFQPLRVFGDVIPFIGQIVGVGIGLVATCTAASLSLLTIAFAWIFYRPLLGVVLLAAAIGLAVLLRKMMKSKGSTQVAHA